MYQPMVEAGVQVFERGWLSSNNVLLLGDDEAPAGLVDTGYHTHAGLTVGLVRRALSGQPLGAVVNTHLHSDHCGGNAALSAAFGCSIHIPAGEADAVSHWDSTRLSFEPTGQGCPRFAFHGVLRAGESMRLGRRSWQVLAAPGHDPHAVVLYEPESQVLVSADALWADGFGVVFPELAGEPGFDDVATTLDLIERLPVRLVVPGHGAPFTDCAAAVGRARRRLDGLQADPRRHALHAAKVLVKFHLLEIGCEPWSSFVAWAGAADYLEQLRARHFGDEPFDHWLRRVVEALASSGAARVEGQTVANR